LFLTPGHTVKLDLFSFNIQRGRDHGIGSVNKVRNFFNMQSKNFSDLFENQAKAEDLSKLYQDADHLDLWLGIIG
jgi:peroxidase